MDSVNIPLASAEKPDMPPRCESPTELKRPPLRRTNGSMFLPSLCGDGSDSDSDEDADKSFCAGIRLLPLRRMGPGWDDEDEDEDDTKFSLDMVEGERFMVANFPAPLIAFITDDDERPTVPVPPGVDIFALDTPPAYHGFSYNALSLVKRVWQCRSRQIARNGGYPPAHATPVLTVTRPPSPDTPAHPVDLNAPIYPRIGYLPSVRNEYSATVDRAFCNFPMYTIHKILYLHDMLDRAGVQASPCSSHYIANEKMYSLEAKPWERDWYMRWQVLVAKTQPPMPCIAMPLKPPTVVEDVDALFRAIAEDEGLREADEARDAARPQSPKFFFAGDDDGDDDEPFVPACTSPAPATSPNVQFLERGMMGMAT